MKQCFRGHLRVWLDLEGSKRPVMGKAQDRRATSRALANVRESMVYVGVHLPSFEMALIHWLSSPIII